MRTSMRENAAKDAKDWAKLALKFGLVLTAPKVWRAIRDQLNDRVEDLSDRLSRGLEDVSDTATRKFGDASDRLSGASDALRGRRPWAGPVTGLVGRHRNRRRVRCVARPGGWERDA